MQLRKYVSNEGRRKQWQPEPGQKLGLLEMPPERGQGWLRVSLYCGMGEEGWEVQVGGEAKAEGGEETGEEAKEQVDEVKGRLMVLGKAEEETDLEEEDY